jgi:archaellum biogenesis ATPase FlaH
MIRILELEKQYLCAVMNGGDIQDITLSEHNERIHAGLKRLRDLGHIKIPAHIIPGTDRIKALDVDYAWTGLHAELIREEQKKSDIKELLASVKYGSSGEIISTLRAELDQLAEEKGRTSITSAEQLKNTEYKNTEFIIDGMIPVGLTLLMGSPKMGKSWLTLLMAECITFGVSLFGYAVKRSSVLYYTLEDSVKRCKFRLNKIHSAWKPDLYFCEDARSTLDIMNGIRSTRAKVVFIDTFMAFSDLEDNNSYSETTRKIRELKRIADTMDVAIVIVHHKKKDSSNSRDWTEEAIGSQGLVGAADCVISLKRKRGDDNAVLLITGRDVSDKHIDIRWDDCVWVKQTKL